MKVALLVEDRDLGYLFTNAEKAHPEAAPYTLELQDVHWNEVEDEDQVMWLLFDSQKKLVARPREGFDFAGFNPDNDGFPIPTPVILLDKDEYDQHTNNQ